LDTKLISPESNNGFAIVKYYKRRKAKAKDKIRYAKVIDSLNDPMPYYS